MFETGAAIFKLSRLCNSCCCEVKLFFCITYFHYNSMNDQTCILYWPSVWFAGVRTGPQRFLLVAQVGYYDDKPRSHAMSCKVTKRGQ